MTEQEFETYWKQHRNEILSRNSEYIDAKEHFNIHNGADLILFGLPIVAGIVFLNNINISNEILTWILSAFVTILTYALCVWIKSAITGTKSPDEVEQTIKERLKSEMTES